MAKRKMHTDEDEQMILPILVQPRPGSVAKEADKAQGLAPLPVPGTAPLQQIPSKQSEERCPKMARRAAREQILRQALREVSHIATGALMATLGPEPQIPCPAGTGGREDAAPVQVQNHDVQAASATPATEPPKTFKTAPQPEAEPLPPMGG